MKLWTFLFPSPEDLFRSARVAAPDRNIATLTLISAIGQDFGQEVICQYAGETPADGPAVVQLLPRDDGR